MADIIDGIFNTGEEPEEEVTVEMILDAARDQGLEDCIVIGRTGEQTMWFNSTSADLREIFWDLEMIRYHILREDV